MIKIYQYKNVDEIFKLNDSLLNYKEMIQYFSKTSGVFKSKRTDTFKTHIIFYHKVEGNPIKYWIRVKNYKYNEIRQNTTRNIILEDGTKIDKKCIIGTLETYKY